VSESTSPSSAPPRWRQIQRETFTHWEKLADFLQLDTAQRDQILRKSTFPLLLPKRLADKIAKGTLDDPILKQFLPVVDEQTTALGFVSDPVSDATFRKESKLLHKYQGRVLLVCTSVCAMHCRYCFRQNFSYEQEDKTFRKELELIKQDNSIHEVILSGGDPLSLSDTVLKELLSQIAAIPHVKRIRFHTRFPIGIPERIDDAFLALLQETLKSKQIWFVVHTNHPAELDNDIFDALKRVQRLGIPVLNQAVLLKGVNDDLNTLLTLCETLADQGIQPYYLHQLDRVASASHFEVEPEKGRALIRELTTRLSGYAVPRYVQEIAGEASKTALI
jgi:EF-P beta-lysylation protein EpmB